MLPRLIRLEPNLVAAAFPLMKLVPAKYVLEKAMKDSKIDRKAGIVETSSGTYALGLGLVCAELGLPFHIVTDPAVDDNLKRRLEDLGGSIQIVGVESGGAVSPQVLRMDALETHLSRFPAAFWPRQYDNPENRDAYGPFAEQLLESIGPNLTLVGAVGSGGSTCGTIARLRMEAPKIKLIGVDTFGSVLFGQPNSPRFLRGLGNSMHPQNLDHRCFDEVHWLSAAEAFHAIRRLHRRHGLFYGPTSGAAYQVAHWVAAQNPDKTVVFMAPDEGHRYAETIYNNHWLDSQGLLQHVTNVEPSVVWDPKKAQGAWAKMDWGRRSFEQVTGESY